MILKIHVALEVNRARFIEWQLFAIFVADVNGCIKRDADCARVGKPLVRIAIDKTVAFAACVILVNYRPPPVDHFFLHFNWAWCRCVNCTFQT